jgi:hypothetical protein
MQLDDVRPALERLTKWRTIFAGWQLGTRASDDPECQAVRDHRELTMMLRAEVTALSGLLIKRGLFTAEEWTIAVGEEAVMLEQDYQQRFPGAKATDDGMQIDARAVSWMSKFPK